MIDFYSAWPFFMSLALLLLLVATPLFKKADTPPTLHTHRIKTMDGMRGFLALAVMFHHAAIYHESLLNRSSKLPPSRLFASSGTVGVSLFFMITGFLFWSQLIRAQGRPSWVALYIGRVFRIGPLYLAAVAAMLAVVAVRAHFTLRESPAALAVEALRWFTLGLLRGPDVNRYSTDLLLRGLTWTLQWEWCFYLSLPLLALFARRKGTHLRFVLGAALCVQAYLHLYRGGPYKPLLATTMLFLLGMLTASLVHEGRLLRLPDAVSSTLVVLLLIGVFRFNAPSVSSLSQLMLAAILYLVVSGTSMFGLLKSQPAIRLGDVSYGIYLLQGFTLSVIFEHPFSRARDAFSPVDHWIFCLASAVLLVCLATATHVWIERPGILAGKWVSSALKARLKQPVASQVAMPNGPV